MTRRSSRKARRAIADATQNLAPAQPAAPSEPTPQSSPSRSSRRGSNSESQAPKRRGSSRRASSRARAAEADSGGRRPPIDRDGKASIACPQCAARYKILEANLESKVTCTQCHRTFFPLAAAKTRHAAPDNTKPILYGVVAVVAIVVVGVIVNSLSAPPPPKKKTGKKVASVDLSSTTEVNAIKAWAKAMCTQDKFSVEYGTDMDAVQKALHIEPKSLYSRSFGDAKAKLGEKILGALFASDQSIIFRAYEPSSGRLLDKAMIEAKSGKVKVNMYPRPTNPSKQSAAVVVSYEYDASKDRFMVTGWRSDIPVSLEYLLESVDKKNPRKKHKPHEVIGKVNHRQISFGGKKETITEAELVALPHLKTTKPEDRKEIDRLVNQLVDLGQSGMSFNRACNALEKYGKAAVPRVLNRMYETRMKSQDDVIVVSRLCRFMRQLTGERFGFNPSINTLGDKDVGASEKERTSALKQWYAWWARYHDRENWRNIDSDEMIELTTAEQKALLKKKAAEAKQKAAERRKRARGIGK